MVNFKQWILPLAVGLFSSRVNAACQFVTATDGSVSISSSSCAPSTDDGYYLVSKEAGTAAAITSGTGILVKVSSSGSTVSLVVVKTPGYYLHKGASSNFVECKVNSDCEIKAYATVSSCDKDKIGEVNDSGLVIGCKKSTTTDPVYLPFTGFTAGKTYLSAFAEGRAFGFDPSIPYYGLKIEENKSITFDSSLEITDDVGLDKDTGIVLTDRKEDFCSGTSSDYYYTCSKGKCTGRKKVDYYETVETIALDSLCTNDGNLNTDKYGATGCTENSGFYIVKDTNKICEIKGTATDCEVVDNFTRGYYWNSFYYNGIIECDGTSCKEIQPTVTSTCSSNTVGQIIDDGYNVYFCKSSSDKVLLSKFASDVLAATTEPKFSIAGNSNGSVFDNTDAYYAITALENETTHKAYALIVDVDYDNKKVNNVNCVKGVCISNECTLPVVTDSNKKSTCTASHCNSSDYDGYHFVDQAGNSVSNDNSAGFLVKFTYSESTCKVISQIKPGAYLNKVEKMLDDTTKVNDKYPLVICTDSECRMKKSPSEKQKYLNLEEDTTKPIISCSGSVCTAQAATNDYYNAGDRRLIQCSKDQEGVISCALSDPVNPNKYYPAKAFEDGEGIVDSVIKCSNDDCEEVVLPNDANDVKVNIFLDGFNEKYIIKCSNDDCVELEGCKSDVGFNKYYKDSSESLELLKCAPGEKCQIAQGSNGYSYITDGTTEIIVCSENVCESKTIAAGKYLNGDKTKVLIDCASGTGCKPADGLADTLFRNNAGGSDDGLILCTGTNQCSVIETDPGKTYVSFPDKKLYTYSVVWGGTDVTDTTIKGYLVNPKNYEVLTDNSVAGKLILCGDFTNPSAGTITCKVPQSNAIESYYINGGYSVGNYMLIENKNSVLSLVKPKKGYYVNTSNILACTDENACDTYTTPAGLAIPTTNKCPADSAGHIIGGKLCVQVGETPIQLSGLKTSSKYLISNIPSSEPLGLASGKNYLFEVGKSKVSIVEIAASSADQYYYFASDGKLIVTKDNRNGSVYKCVAADSSCTKENLSSGEVKVYPNSDIETAGVYPRIKCTYDGEVKCNSEGPSTSDFYCAVEAKLYQCQESTTLRECPSNESDAKTKCNLITHQDGYYLSVMDNSSLIKCVSGTGCKKTTDIPEVLYEGYCSM